MDDWNEDYMPNFQPSSTYTTNVGLNFVIPLPFGRLLDQTSGLRCYNHSP
jgi:hypothetical protein